MKLSDAKANKKQRPFYQDENITVSATAVGNKFVSFSITILGKSKVFPVKNNQIVKAWKEMECHFLAQNKKLNLKPRKPKP